MGYRNAGTIAGSVRSVVDQDSTMPFEVVVVTSGGDESGSVVAAAWPDLPLHDSAERLLPGGARNVGVRMARGRYVAFLAADCRAEPGWVDARIRAHATGHRVVAGAVGATWPDRPWAWAALYLGYRDRLPTSRPAGPVEFPSPAMHGLSYERALLQELGGFDETMRTGEDTDMARRLGARGIPAWFEPGASIAHHGPVGTWALATDQYRRGSRYVRDTNTAPPGDGRSARLLVIEAGRTARSIRATLGAGWRHDRRRAVAAAPWVVLGAVALRFGRFEAFAESRQVR